MNFDLSKEWSIIYPAAQLPSKKPIEDLSRCLGLLARHGGANTSPPPIMDAYSPPDSEILIILNCLDGGAGQNGYEWRA